MEKVFRTLTQDPWNKLKIYMCLRVIEHQPDPAKRARLFIELAQVRKAFDPVMTLKLAEVALKLAPNDAVVQSRLDDLLKPWLPKTQPAKEAGLEVRPAQGPAKNQNKLPQGPAAEAKNFHEQRKAMVAQLKAQLGKSGIDGYVRELLKSKMVPDHLIGEIQGFQTNWTGMVQFIDYLKSKRSLTNSQCADILDDMEQTLFLTEPQNPAIGRLRSLRSLGN